MGCAQSRVNDNEAVTSSAHSAYAASLKDTGAALSEFGQVAAHDSVHSSSSSSSSGGGTSVTGAPSSPPLSSRPPRPSYLPRRRSRSSPPPLSIDP
ncbi:hypothetical protein OPV22_014899 [Ensete ventricosum]|uniref:DUF630 domain-containing protein n=1 Tax=Ensete ventricosum TaxID=4639 RepID=A0AAV8PL34_ENSVE|nr:hypothetical protein OPV22_014899 [Ensete ventricosum]